MYNFLIHLLIQFSQHSSYQGKAVFVAFSHSCTRKQVVLYNPVCFSKQVCSLWHRGVCMEKIRVNLNKSNILCKVKSLI